MGYSLPNHLKLKSAEQFRSAFLGAKKLPTRYLAVFFKTNKLAYSRLGIIIAKRNVHRAVDRNRLKRLIRESFRLHQHRIAGVDIVVVCYRGADSINNVEFIACLEKQWQRLTLS